MDQARAVYTLYVGPPIMPIAYLARRMIDRENLKTSRDGLYPAPKSLIASPRSGSSSR
jgi:hypothetical protein